VATRLARRHGLRSYNADTRTWALRDRALLNRNDAALRWESLTPDAHRGDSLPDVDELVAMSLQREGGPMVVDDLRRLPTVAAVEGLFEATLAEGPRAESAAERRALLRRRIRRSSRSFATATRAPWAHATTLAPGHERAR
jgi:hypothetical protein